MSLCKKCGMRVEFRVIDGQRIPLHLDGACSGTGGVDGGAQVQRSAESSCVRTLCRTCKKPVYFIRYNGGSVWIDPPLGPPWDRHPCMESRTLRSGAIVAKSLGAEIGPDLAGMLGGKGRAIIGVVVKSEISTGRKETILSLAVAQPEELVLLIKGGADSFLGNIVVVDGAKCQIYCLDAPRYALTVTATLYAPQAFVDGGMDLPPALSGGSAIPFRKDRAPKPGDGLSAANAKLMGKFRTTGLTGKWSLPDLIALVPLLQGTEQNVVIHHTAVRILEHAEKHSDCSGAARLVAQAPVAKRFKLGAWFRKFSPISVDIQRNVGKAHLVKDAEGNKKPYDIAAAKRSPVYANT